MDLGSSCTDPVGRTKGNIKAGLLSSLIGWHHWLYGHEFEQALGDGEGQGSLACCSPWGRKESDNAEWLTTTFVFIWHHLSGLVMWIILVLCLCYINLLLIFSYSVLMKGFKAMFLYFQQWKYNIFNNVLTFSWFLQDYIRKLIPGWWSDLLWPTEASEMGAASSQQLWFLNSKDSQLLQNRPINWYLFSPRGDTCFCRV